MKTPVQELFYRLEQFRFAKDPVSEMFKLQEVMLEREKKLFKITFDNGFFCCCGKNFDNDASEVFIKPNTKENEQY